MSCGAALIDARAVALRRRARSSRAWSGRTMRTFDSAGSVITSLCVRFRSGADFLGSPTNIAPGKTRIVRARCHLANSRVPSWQQAYRGEHSAPFATATFPVRVRGSVAMMIAHQTMRYSRRLRLWFLAALFVVVHRPAAAQTGANVL